MSRSAGCGEAGRRNAGSARRERAAIGSLRHLCFAAFERTPPQMTHVLHRSIAHRYPTATSGEGIFIRDETGNDYIDASGGAAVSCLGHSHPEIISAMRAQLDKLEYAHTSFFTSQPAEELADDLAAHAPAGLGHAFFVSGGPRAIEARLKLPRQYFLERV